MQNGGILIVNKTKGQTSFDVIRKARKALNIRKIGHAGTLDPFAEGVLILAINEDTKALNWLSKEDKVYITELKLGFVSDSHDKDGEISKYSDKKPDKKEIEAILGQFKGRILQTPPKYSAIKINGKRACDRMRAGEEVEIQPRFTEVYDLEILDYKYPSLIIRIHCASGFYVRSLARDLGESLETGAFCETLLREKVGNFSLNQATEIEKISPEKIIPLCAEHFSFPSLQVGEKEAFALRQGKKIPSQGGGLRSVFLSQEIVCIGEVQNGLLKPLRVFADSQEK